MNIDFKNFFNRPIRSPGPHGFGRAITRGLDAMTDDAVVIMMADESDDLRKTYQAEMT